MKQEDGSQYLFNFKTLITMENTINNPTIVSDYSTGQDLAIKFFMEEMNDNRKVLIRKTGEHSYECYTDSGSDDYFYFKVEA